MIGDERIYCYCCDYEIEDPEPWTIVDPSDNIAFLCDSCSAELAHFMNITAKAKLLSMRNEKEFQNQRREKAQVPEQMRLV